MKDCPKCGHQNSTDAQYCEKCGKSFTISKSSQKRVRTSTMALIISIILLSGILGVSIALLQTSFIKTDMPSVVVNQTPIQNSTNNISSNNQSSSNVDAESKYITLTCQRCGKQFQVLREGEHPYYCDDCLNYIASQKKNGQNTY